MKPEDCTISRFGRGICREPACGRSISLTRKGVLRTHGAKTPGVWPPMECPGSGEPPKEES